MSVLINFKICDNAKECSGIGACPTGAIFWSAVEEKIGIDSSKCNSCGKCEIACPVGAIHVAKNKEEYEKIRVEIENDYRSIDDLFVDRYGAVPIDDKVLVNIDEFDSRVKKSKGILIVEVFNESSIQCLLNSIPIKEILKNLKSHACFLKMELADTLKERFKVSELPSLLIYKSGNFLGKISGYYEIDQQEQIFSAVSEILLPKK